MRNVYEKFGLEPGTQDFIGHAMALYLDDECAKACFSQNAIADSHFSYIDKPARQTYERIVLYTSSMARYGKSPYIYPLYGLGELPQAFARLSAIYGGTYMLDKPIHEIVTDSDGKFVGVRSGSETVKAKQVIGDPSYFVDNQESGKIRVVEEGKVVRAICILKHPIPGTEDADSVQLILPQNQINRRHGIFFCSSLAELQPPLNLLRQIFTSPWSRQRTMSARRTYMLPSLVQLSRQIDQSKRSLLVSGSSVPSTRSTKSLFLMLQLTSVPRFISVTPLYTPISDGADNIFITRSYDATSHFETVVEDVQDVWKMVIGQDLVLKKREIQEVQE
jgi:Rab GDP dissociation inhibitor